MIIIDSSINNLLFDYNFKMKVGSSVCKHGTHARFGTLITLLWF